MGRTLPPNFRDRSFLLNALGNNQELKKLGKDDLCWEAYDKGLISKDECESSLNRKESIIPCYLYTHVQNVQVRKLIEDYVQCYSKLFSRGSIIANLVTISLLPPSVPSEFPLQAYCAIPLFLKDDNSLKKCFLPERWSDDKVDPTIINILHNNVQLLQPLLPSNYLDILPNTGWDNALNFQASMYMGHVKVQILTHLFKRVKEYFVSTCNSETDLYVLKKFINSDNRPFSGIHIDDLDRIQQFRNCLNIGHTDYINSQFTELNDYIWSLHYWLLQKQSEHEKLACSILPIVKLNRKYSYIDHKILKALLPLKIKKEILDSTKHDHGSEFQKLLGITPEKFNKNRSISRKKLRNKERRGSNRTFHRKTRTNKNAWKSNRNKKKRKKWKCQGRSCLSKNAEIASIMTDGVGMRICCKYVMERKINKKPCEDEPTFPSNCLKVGIDTGRVRMITSVDNEGNVFMMKRKAYYYAQRHKRMMDWENSRKTNTRYGEAMAAMSQAGGFKNTDIAVWTSTLQAQNQYLGVIIEEQINNKERAHKKMARFRYKKSWLDRSIRQWLEPIYKNKTKRHALLGFGDGKFPCTGKGEMAVPTTEIQKTLKKMIKILSLQRYIKLIAIDEYNTTKCCHRCDNEMQKLITHGRECSRYRLCTQCTHKTNGKTRHRDVNASRNILKLLELRAHGLLRPEHLVCPWRKEKNVAFPPLVRTA